MYRRPIPTFENFQADTKRINESESIITLDDLGDDSFDKIIANLWANGFGLHDKTKEQKLREILKGVKYEMDGERSVLTPAQNHDISNIYNGGDINKFEKVLDEAISLAVFMMGRSDESLKVNEFNDSDVRKLPDTYKNAGFTFKQIKRGDKAVIYGDEDSGTYEVFKIKVAPATTINTGGKSTSVPARERIPGNNDFGEWAYSVNSLERAEARFNELNK